MPERGVSAGAPSDVESLPEDAPRVLVVDDEELVRQSLARILSRHAFRVTLAEDAETALRALQQDPFDLVISDITMPGMSGIEFVERVRTSGNDVPFVMMTGAPMLETAVKAVEQGVVRYLTKPIDPPTLASTARGAIRLHGVARAKRLALDNDALRSLVDELTHARAAEQAASVAKSRFLAQMSHELRTPLTHIMGFTDLALEGEPSQERREYLETSQRAATSLLALINGILEFSSLSAGSTPFEPHAVAMRTALAETMAPLVTAGAHKKLKVTLDVDPGLPETLTGDAPKFRRVLEHVVGNSIKFTKSGGWIAVRVDGAPCSDDAVLVRVCVRDSGVGIPRAARDQIFGVFVQADNSSTRAHGGAGMGLAVSALLVQLMHGTIDVESVEGIGTAVTFTARFGTTASPDRG